MNIFRILGLFLLTFLVSCDSKLVYLSTQDKEILQLIEKEQAEKLITHFAPAVEFDYGSEASIMFSPENDLADFLTGNKSEYYRFLFGLDDVFREKNWVSFKDALKVAYRVQGENGGVNPDKSYNRFIHIYSDKSYNRIGLKCAEENNCKINYLFLSSSKPLDMN